MKRKAYRVKANFELVDLPSWEESARERGLLVSLEEAGLEEIDEGHNHGYHNAKGSNGSIYEYTDWFYDGDESAFSII